MSKPKPKLKSKPGSEIGLPRNPDRSDGKYESRSDKIDRLVDEATAELNKVLEAPLQQDQRTLKQRGLNLVRDPTAPSMKASQASVDRRTRSTGRTALQDFEAGQTGFSSNLNQKTRPTARGVVDPGLPSTVTAQNVADVGQSTKQFKQAQDQRMQTRTGITQPKIPGAQGGEGHIDPSAIHDQQLAIKNNQRPSVRNSKFK